MFNTVLGNLLVRLTGDSTQFEKMIAGAEAVFDRASKRLMGVGGLMTRAITLPLAAIGAMSVKTSSDFDQAMTHSLVKFGDLGAGMKVSEESLAGLVSKFGHLSVSAKAKMDKVSKEMALHSGSHLGDVSAGMRAKMEENARDISKRSTSSALELAEAYGHMRDAGMSAANAVTDLDYIQKFAFRNTLSLERATAFLTDSMNELGLKSEDPVKNLKNMTMLGDQMTATTEMAGVSIEELAKSIEKHGGSAMRRFNIDTAEGLGLLAAFAKQGAKAGQGGQYLADLLGQRRMGTRRGVAGDAADILLRNSAFAKQVQDRLNSSSTKGLVDRESAAMLKNFNDQMTILWNNIKDVGIEIGRVLTPALEWLNKKLIEGAKWWHSLSNTTKTWIVWIGFGLAILGPFLTALGMVIGLVTWINWTFLGWMVLITITAGALLGLIDVFLQMTTGINIGFADMIGNFRIGGFKIVTWLAAGFFGAAMAWEFASTIILTGFKFLWMEIRDIGGGIYRFLVSVIKFVVVAWLGGLKLLAIGLDIWVANLNKVLSALGLKTFTVGFAAGLKGATDEATAYFDNKIAQSLYLAKDRHEQFYKDIGKMGKDSAKQQAEYMKNMLGLFADDAQDKRAQDAKDKAAAEAGKLSIPELSMPGVDLPDFGAAKAPGALGKAQEFQQISRHRFNLSGSVSSANKKEVQHVVAKGVEEKMDTLIQVTKEKNTLAVMQ